MDTHNNTHETNGAPPDRIAEPRLVYPVALALVWLAPSVLPVPPTVASSLSNGMFLAATVVACALCVWAARFTRRHERLAWSYLALGAGFTIVADVYTLITGGGIGSPWAGSSAEAMTLWAAALLMYFAAAVSFAESPRVSPIERTRRAIDFVLMVFFCATSVFAFILSPIAARDPGQPLGATLMAAAALALSLSIVVRILILRPTLRGWLLPLAWALTLMVVGAAIALGLVLMGGTLATGAQLATMPWFVATGLLGYAAWLRLAQHDRLQRSYVIALHEPGLRWGLLLTLVMFCALPVFVFFDETWQGDSVSQTIFSTAVFAYAITAIGRNLVIALENSSLRRRSTTDALTGLFNHRHFHERLDAEVTRAEREGGSLSVAIMDVDDFDRVNNIYGHAVGDRRLHSIAERLSDSARGSDIVCRVGGDEFAVVMPDTDPIEAYKVCLRLQDEMCEPDGVCPLTTSVSIGIASVPAHARSREELVQKADGALYWAKFHGREQVVIFDADLVQALGPEQRIAMLREEAYLNMVHLLAAAVDARDQYTRRHSANVASLVVALAGDLAFSAQHTAHLETAALLHDIGKIGIPDALLRKESPLSGPERASVAEHPQLATRILSAIPRREILPWIESHHERWDGSGYPIGLAGEDIPLEARMIALCDAYDAMTTDRPYREASSPASARAELLEHAGTQFDPQLTARFVEMLERRHEAPQAHVQGHPVPRPAEAAAR